MLVDVAMSGLNGLETTARLVKEFPDLRVIILSMHANEEYIWQALRAGASGYLLKSASTSCVANECVIAATAASVAKP